MKEMMEITQEEADHLSSVMRDRGMGHCQFCVKLEKRLNDHALIDRISEVKRNG